MSFVSTQKLTPPLLLLFLDDINGFSRSFRQPKKFHPQSDKVEKKQKKVSEPLKDKKTLDRKAFLGNCLGDETGKGSGQT